jgi:hypothetical protein
VAVCAQSGWVPIGRRMVTEEEEEEEEEDSLQS